jgi:hypothetical protein
MPRRMTSNNRSRRVNNSRRGLPRNPRSSFIQQALPNPPQWSSTVTTAYVQRFVATSGINGVVIDTTELFDLKCVATTATSAARIFGGLKVTGIEIWAANSSATASNTIQLEWLTQNPFFGAPSRIVSDTAIGTSNVAHIKTKPPRNSFAAEWLPITPEPNGDPAPSVFSIVCPQGSIVDVHMVVALRDIEGASFVSGTVAAATTGILYTRHLDSTELAPALTPIGDFYI